MEGCVREDGSGIPGKEVLLYRQIAALVAVGPDVSAGFCLEFREELTNKSVGDSVSNFPALSGAPGFGVNGRLFGNETNQIMSVRTLINQHELQVHIFEFEY